jgi:hypothetical protein
MKWEIKDNKPKVGDIRFVTKFAWLELYIEEQMYTSRYDGWDGSYEYWCTVAKTIHV